MEEHPVLCEREETATSYLSTPLWAGDCSLPAWVDRIYEKAPAHLVEERLRKRFKARQRSYRKRMKLRADLLRCVRGFETNLARLLDVITIAAEETRDGTYRDAKERLKRRIELNWNPALKRIVETEEMLKAFGGGYLG